MANFQKFTKTDKVKVNAEIERKLKDYKNNVDKEKTHLNYRIGIIRENPTQYANERIEQSKHLKRENIIHQINLVLTLPRDYDGNERTFFQNAYNFIKNDFGEKNIIGAWVHKDETTTHMHIPITPITEDNRLCAKEILTKEYLTHFHDRLQEHLRQKDPTHTINILREDKEKEKSLPLREYKLKQQERELEEKEKQLQERQKNYQQTKDYNNLIDRYCNDKDISIHQYYRDVFYYDRDMPTSYGIPVPEAINPARTIQERELIKQQYIEEREILKEQEHQRNNHNR